MRTLRSSPFLPILFAIAPLLGCAELKTTGKVVATPLTVVRDTVDAPLVSITNVFEFFADHTKIAKTPHAGVGVGLGGISPYIGYDLSFFLFKGLSYALGSVDYIIGRSLWPNWPKGVSPWLEDGGNWGDLYYPSTRELWKEEPPAPAGKPETEEAPKTPKTPKPEGRSAKYST